MRLNRVTDIDATGSCTSSLWLLEPMQVLGGWWPHPFPRDQAAGGQASARRLRSCQQRALGLLRCPGALVLVFLPLVCPLQCWHPLGPRHAPSPRATPPTHCARVLPSRRSLPSAASPRALHSPSPHYCGPTLADQLQKSGALPAAPPAPVPSPLPTVPTSVPRAEVQAFHTSRGPETISRGTLMTSDESRRESWTDRDT